MAKNKDPAFMFYPADFMIGTFFMTNEEVGIYIRMLCMQHQQGRLSAEEMDSMCGNRSKVRAKFVMDENGMYYNNRLGEEIAKRQAFCDKQRNNRLNAITKSQPSLNQTSTKLKPNSNPHVENENINENIDSIDNNNINTTNIIQQRFNQFWSAYPKKVGKAYAKQCFDRLKPTSELTQKMLDAIAEQKKSVEWTKDNGQFIPNPSTWLNQGRWDDELRTSHDGAADVVPKYSSFDAEQAMQAAIERSLKSLGG